MTRTRGHRGGTGRGGGGQRGASSARRGKRGGVRGGRRGGASKIEKAIDEEHVEIFQNLDIASDVKPFFLQPVPFSAHLEAQEKNKYRYLAAYEAMKNNGVEVLQGAKIRALAAAWARHDLEIAGYFLADSDSFTVAEILKVIQLLDSGRQRRSEEKRLEQMTLQMTKAGKKGKNRIGRRMVEMKKKINNLAAKTPTKGTVSGALARKIKRWTRQLQRDKLEFFALHLPTETWKQLADICHLNPEKDFPNLPWFLKYCFDGPEQAPPDALVRKCVGLNGENVNEYVFASEVPYSHIKKYANKLKDYAKKRIVEYTLDLDTVLWNYEDLHCKETDQIVSSRLDYGSTVSLPYGKLMERLLLLRKMRAIDPKSAVFYPKLMPQAERLLNSVKIPVEAPVVVIGDASASMEVAIETATIIGSFIGAITNAQLCFFSNDFIEPPFVPKTVEQVIELALKVKTIASTCHAAGLWPFYRAKKVVKTFIITTDEEENTDWQDGKNRYRFQALFTKYHKEVYPARLVFVSFLHNQHSNSQMVDPLRAAGFDVMQFKLDKQRPDLSKINNLIGQLALESPDFDHQLTQLESELRINGLQAAFEKTLATKKSDS